MAILEAGAVFSHIADFRKPATPLVHRVARELIVIHSHSHRDHYSGDSQFAGKLNVTIVEPN